MPHAEANLKLVAADGGDPVTTTLVITQGTGSEHRAVLQLVRDHLDRFEEFGIVTFQMRKITAGPGRPETYAVLNEHQASLLLTFMRNNEVVVDFKVRLIKAFQQMREMLRGGSDEPSDARPVCAADSTAGPPGWTRWPRRCSPPRTRRRTSSAPAQGYERRGGARFMGGCR